MNDVFQFLTMRFFNDVSKNCKTSCKRCISHDASPTPIGWSPKQKWEPPIPSSPICQILRRPLTKCGSGCPWTEGKPRPDTVYCARIPFFAQRWLILSKFLGIEERIGGCTLCCRINVKDIKRRRINIYRWEGSNQNKTDWPWQGRKVDNGMRNIKDVHPELFNLF